jgi:hypothetical protein
MQVTHAQQRTPRNMVLGADKKGMCIPSHAQTFTCASCGCVFGLCAAFVRDRFALCVTACCLKQQAVLMLFDRLPLCASTNVCNSCLLIVSLKRVLVFMLILNVTNVM